MKKYIETIKQNKTRLLPLGILFFLMIAVALTMILARTRQQTRTRAAADSAILTFNPTQANPTNTAPGNTFTTSVILNTGNQAVVGADIIVKFDQNKLTLQNITKSTHANFKTYTPITTSNAFDTTRILNTANSTGKVEFGIVTFDMTTNTVTPAFNGTMATPPVTTLTFQVKPGATNPVTPITFDYVSATSTTDSNVVLNPSGSTTPEDILLAPTSQVAVTIGNLNPSPSASPLPTPGVSPSPTPLPSPSATPAPSPSASPDASPSGNQASVYMLIRFEAVNSGGKPDKNVKVTLKQGSTVVVPETTLVFTQNFTGATSGYYKNQNAPLLNVTPGVYDIYIDGPVHLTKKFANQTITAGSNINTPLSLTSSFLFSGDVFDDEIVNANDYNDVVTFYGCPTTGNNGCVYYDSDFDFNGNIGVSDYNSIIANYNLHGDQ